MALSKITDSMIPALTASKLTGALPAVDGSALTGVATDVSNIENDLSTLALRQASNENKVAYNTNSMYIDVFQDSTGITGLTDTERNASEFVSSASIPEILTITLGTELGGFSAAGAGEVANTAATLINGNFSTNSWTYRTTNTTINSIAGDVGEFGSHATYYKASTFSFGGLRMWSGHNNLSSSLGAKDVAVYTSTDTTNGLNGTWTITTPITLDSGTESGSDRKHAGGRTSQISSNHFVLTDYYNTGQQTISYADTVGFEQVTGIKGIRFDIRTAWGTGYYGSEKPHMKNMDIFDDSGVSSGSVSATGSFTSNTITAPSSITSMGAIITYQDNAGTNALNTDIILKLSADDGVTYSTATLTSMPNFSTGIKMAKVNGLAVTAGTSLKYKIEFANQVISAKVAHIRGVSLQY